MTTSTSKRIPSPDSAPGSVLGELARLDKIVRDCEHSIALSDRLKALNRWKPQWDGELATTREKLTATLGERDRLDGSIARYLATPAT